MSLEQAICYLQSTQTEFGSSRWSSLRSCALSHHLRYELGIRRKQRESLPLDVGSLIHAGIRFVTDDPSRSWMDLIRAHEQMSDELDIHAHKVRTEAVRLLDAYFDAYGVPGWDHEVVGTEVHLAVDVGGSQYTTALDTLLKKADGSLLLVDTKTISGLSADLEEVSRHLKARPQFLGSVFAARKVFNLDCPPPMMVNYIVKTQKPRFHRLTLEFSDSDLNWWAQAHAHSIAVASSCAPNPDACWPQGWKKCEFFEHCRGTKEERENLYERNELIWPRLTKQS